MPVLTVNWLVDAVHTGLSVWDTAQAGTRKQTQAARNDTGFITDDVTKEVARNNNSVKSPRVLDHEHGRGVDEMSAGLEVGELVLHDALEGLSPQPRSRKHVGLVQAPDRDRWVLHGSEVSC